MILNECFVYKTSSVCIMFNWLTAINASQLQKYDRLQWYFFFILFAKYKECLYLPMDKSLLDHNHAYVIDIGLARRIARKNKML